MRAPKAQPASSASDSILHGKVQAQPAENLRLALKQMAVNHCGFPAWWGK
jgi:hypothetical protein